MEVALHARLSSFLLKRAFDLYSNFENDLMPTARKIFNLFNSICLDARETRVSTSVSSLSTLPPPGNPGFN
jgi:hypothetical protein